MFFEMGFIDELASRDKAEPAALFILLDDGLGIPETEAMKLGVVGTHGDDL